MTRPAWLAERIALRSRQARPNDCRGCGAQILAGLDADWCAFPATVDATPVGHLEATIAYLGGRKVLALIHGELHRLDGLQLVSCHRNGLPLHLTHQCPTRQEDPQ